MVRRVTGCGSILRSLMLVRDLARPRRLVAGMVALNVAVSSVAGPLSPAHAQVISDPRAPIQFRPGITSSANGTPTVNITRPSPGGVSHNQFREYNIDTRGLILNNSGLGGTSIIGGQMGANPNLKPGGEARIIVNEVTGTRRSNLNGVTEVFGTKADVIVANPNGIGCVGCGFINTGTATLSTGVPIIDRQAGRVGFETRKGAIAISGAGVAARAGQMPDHLNLIGRNLDIGGLVEARGRVGITAGATRIDPVTGAAGRIAEAAPASNVDAIVSNAAGVIRAASIDVLSSDLDTGVFLAGNLQALGSYDGQGGVVAGDLSIVSAGGLGLVAAEASGRARVQAGGRFQLARDLSAGGEIAITAHDISLLDSAGTHAGKDLMIVSQADIVSKAVLKSGGTLAARAGGDASYSGLIGAAGGLELSAARRVATGEATLIAPTIGLVGDTVDVTGTWIVPARQATIAGVDVTLGKETAFDAAAEVNVDAARRLTIGTVVDTSDYPALSLAFRDLAISESGVFASDDHVIHAGTIDNAGVLVARGAASLDAETLNNQATGVIQAGTIAVKTSTELTNLGQILSASSLALLAQGNMRNDGTIGTDGILTLRALSYTSDAQARLLAGAADLAFEESAFNRGAILASGALGIEAGGSFVNAGEIRAGGDLNLTVADLVNFGEGARIDSNAGLFIRSAGTIDNRLGGISSAGRLDLVAGQQLTNSGLLLGQAEAAILAGSLDNRTEGRIHARTITVDMHGGDLANLGQIVSAGTLQVVRAGDVLNDGIFQAGGALRLEALSYTADAARAELVAASADLMVDGALKNAGLIAVAGNIGLDVGTLFNAGSGEIVARALEAKVAGDLTNLGRLLSEETLQATVTGLLANSGDIRSGGDLDLTVADLVNSGARALIAGNRNATIAAARGIANHAGSIAAGSALTLEAAAALTNSGLLEGADLSLTAGGLDNQAGGRIHAGWFQNTADGILAAGALVIRLSGDLANLGQIVSANALDVTSARSVTNTGSIEAGGDLRLEAHAYVPGSPAARLAARNLDLILGSSFTNDGLLSVVGRLGLDIDGDLVNTQTGRIEAGAIEMAIARNLTNLGSILSQGTLEAVVAGVLTNEGTIRSGAGMTLQAGALVNRGEGALIGADGDLSIKVAGNLDNLLGRILARGGLGIEAGGTLTNASARIESGADMMIAAAALINTVIAGTDGGTIDFHELGELTVDYSYDRDEHIGSDDHETWVSAVRDEFAGTIRLDRAGVIRSGRDLILEGDLVHNENGRILAVNDLSIDTRILVNDAQTHAVDHYKLEWGHYTDDDYLPFTAPDGGGWGVGAWKPGVLTDQALASIVGAMPRRTVTRSTYEPARFGQPGAQYVANGPNGPGYYIVTTTTSEEVIVGYRTVTKQVGGGGDGGPQYVNEQVPVSYPQDYLLSPEGQMIVFEAIGSLLISTGDSPVSVRGSDDVSQAAAEEHARLKIFEHVNPADFLNLEALGIDPDDMPETIVLSNRIADLADSPYGFKGRTLVGEATVAQGSVIKSGGVLLVGSDQTTNRGTLDGSLVSIEGGTLDNGIGAIGGVDGSGFGRFDRTGLGGLAGGSGSGIGLAAGGAGIVDFVLDDVAVPPLDLGAFNQRNLVSLDPNDFGNLQKFTGSLEAARLLAGVGNITGAKLSFYADPVQEAKALAEAALRATGSQLVIDPSLSPEEQREQLYRNAADFAAETGARYGVALTEAQRAALTKPIVWHETRIVDGKPVLVPRLYLPSSDELLRGGRGPGLIAADDLLIDLSGRLSNSGTLAAKGLASISASAVINQRMIDLDMRERAYAGGRGDTGLITAGTLLMTTDGDLVNRGGTVTSAGALDLRIGGSLINETQRYVRAVDGFDLCLGNACGGDAVDYNVARITAGRDLTVIAGRDLVNAGGELGSVTDMLLAAGGDVRFETLKDAFVSKDFHQRGFFSGKDIVEHRLTTAEASAQSLVGDVSIFAGYGVCDGGRLCAGNGQADAVLDGALVSAYGNVRIDATGAIDMGVVSEEAHNTYKEWGFKGLGWGKVQQKWNDVSTSVTRISGDNVTLNATGPITGTGTKIAAAGDLLMMTDGDIRFQAAQDARYFTEKGFYIGLTFPGSAGINAALQGGSGADVLSGLADVNPLTRTLTRLANADNGLAAGLAAVDLVTGGASLFGNAASAAGGADAAFSSGAFGKALGDQLNPLSQFTDENGDFSLKNFGISISSWKNEQRWSQSQIAELVAGGDVVMKAGLDVILDQGTKLVAGEDVSIDAGRDIVLAALVDYAKDKSSSFGLNLSLTSIGFDMAKSEGYDEVLTNASIQAGGNVSLKSGRDTALLGANITGRSVALDVGRDLTILSPQAQGWRDGYSFGLTIGIDPFSFGIRGSSEDGSKAWSSGSSITAVEGIDISVGRDTVLAGALLNATDGDINLETETLTVSDNRDHDQYRTVGGSIGFAGGGLDTAGFSYEETDRRGETRTTLDAAGELSVTIHDADGDGVRDTEADRAAAAEQIAAINRDAADWQAITRDSHTKLSGELNVSDLRALSDNVKAIQNYNRAQNAVAPDAIAAQGPRAVDVWRKMIINGASISEATRATQSSVFEQTVGMLEGYDAAVAAYGDPSEVPLEVRQAIALGQTVLFGEASKYDGGSVLVACDTFGTCEVELNAYLQTLKANPNAVEMMIAQATDTLEQFLASGAGDTLDINSGGLLRVEQAFLQLVICVDNDPVGAASDLAAAYRGNPDGFAALAYSTAVYNGTTILNAVESYAANGNAGEFAVAMELAKYPPAIDLEGIVSLAKFGYELTPVADAEALIVAAQDGDIAGMMIAGIGFIPVAKIGKLIGKGTDVVKTALKNGGDDAAEMGKQVAQKAPIHHICTDKNCVSTARGGPWTPRFEQIFQNAGLDLQDALNKVAVPGHKGPHPQEYHAYVLEKLSDATLGLRPGTTEYKHAVEGTLNKLGEEAIKPGSLVNKWLTKQ